MGLAAAMFENSGLGPSKIPQIVGLQQPAVVLVVVHMLAPCYCC